MRRYRLSISKFSIRTLLVLTVFCAFVAWDIARQQSYENAIQRFQSVFPGSSISFDEPIGARKLQSQILKRIGLGITNRRLRTLELCPEEPSQVTVLTPQQEQFLSDLPPATFIHLNNFEFSLARVKLRLRQDSESSLCLGGCRLRHSSLGDLRSPFLQRLELNSCSELEGLDTIDQSLPNLRSLSLEFMPRIDNLPLSLRLCGQLESLTISGPSIDDTSIEGIEKLSNLSSLSIWNAPVSDTPFTELTNLTKLYFVRLHSTQVTDNTMVQLAKLPNLRKLDLSNSHRLTDQGIAHLRNNTQLEVLEINGIQRISDDSAEAIGSLSSLEQLWAGGTGIGRKTLIGLAPLPKLQTMLLDWGDLQVDDFFPLDSSSVAQIIVIGRGEVREATLTPTQIRWLAGLDTAPNVIAVNWLRGLKGKHLQAWHKSVTEVDLRGCQLDASVIEELASRPAIQTLDLSYTNVDTKMLRSLRTLQNLQHLILENCPHVDNDIVLLIRELPILTKINLRQTDVSVDMPNHVQVDRMKPKGFPWSDMD